MKIRREGDAFKRRANVPAAGFAAALTVVGTFPVWVVPAAAQQESQDLRYLTVLQRPRDQYDPQGLPIGSGLRLLPSVDVTESYDDNIYARKTNSADDFITTISPKLKLESDWSRHKLTVNAYADIHRYINRTTEDNDEYGANANLALDLAYGGNLGLSAGYSRQTIARGDPENSGRLDPELVDQTQAKIDWGQKFSYLLLGASVSFLDWQEVSALDADKNRKEYTGSVRVGYIFSPALSVFVQPYYTDRDFDLPVDFGGRNRDSTLMGIDSGVSYDITGVLYGETRIGWYTANFAQAGVRNDSGLSIQSNTTWNLTARDSILLQIERTNVISSDFTASSRVLTGAKLEYQHELRRNIVLTADAEYYNDEFISSTPNRTDHRFAASLQATYYIDRHFSLYAKYQRESVNSTLDTESYDENQILLGVRAQL